MYLGACSAFSNYKIRFHPQIGYWWRPAVKAVNRLNYAVAFSGWLHLSHFKTYFCFSNQFKLLGSNS